MSTASVFEFPEGEHDDARVIEELLAALAARGADVLPDSAAGLVLGLDPKGLSQKSKLAAIRVAERAKAALDAAQSALVWEFALTERADFAEMNALCDLPGQHLPEPERESIANTLRLTPLSASNRVHLAEDLCVRLPEVFEAQRSGWITALVGRIIVEGVIGLPDDVAHQVAVQVLPMARNAPPTRVRRRVDELVARLDPQGSLARQEHAVTQRCVKVLPEFDGMASLWWTADAATIAAAYDHIDDAARQLLQASSEAGEQLSIDAARSDALSWLLLNEGESLRDGTSERKRRRPVVAVHVNLSTLLGADDEPAEVPGHGFIPAETAREMALCGDWRVFLHSADGRLTAIGTKSYSPTDAMADLVIARDKTCRFPGCAQPAHRCDIDHITPYDHGDPASGGPTEPDNLQALCRRHHNLKTNRHWEVASHDDGSTTWTGPHGQEARVEHDPDPPF